MTDSMNHIAEAVKVSVKIQDLKEELDGIPVKVREIESRLGTLQEKYSVKKIEWDTIETEKRQLESEIELDTENLKNKEERLNAIKTQKEYQAVVREISTARTLNKERKERIKGLLGSLERLQEDLEPLEQELQSLKSELNEEKKNIQGSLNRLDEEIKSLETQLKEQLSALPDDIREKYKKIEQRLQPPAALVVNGTCQECFMSIPPQLYIEIQKQHQILTCPNCHRILYLETD